MRSKILLATGTALLGLAAGWLIGRQPAPKPEAKAPEPGAPQPEVPLMPLPRKPDIAAIKPPGTLIPLSDVYATVRQPGPHTDLNILPVARHEDLREEVYQLKRRLDEFPVQTVFVVRAFTIHGAVSQTLTVLRGQGLAHDVSLTGQDGPEPLWVFVFLGNGSTSPTWLINSVQYNGGEVVVRYSAVKHFYATGTSSPYSYWFKLNDVHPGRLTIRLVDGGEVPNPLVRSLMEKAGVKGDSRVRESIQTLMVSVLVRP